MVPAERTEDPTYSWEQPPSKGVGGYYGYCGPTAAANLVTNECGHRITPITFAAVSFGWGPGTSPRSLVRTLNQMGRCGYWSLCGHDEGDFDVFRSLENNLPAATLMDWSIKGMHWVTVVAIHREPRCEVVFNHWGRQEVLDCDTFIERWSSRSTSLGSTAVASRVVQPFTYVCRPRL